MTPAGLTASPRPTVRIGPWLETGVESWHSMAMLYEVIGTELERELAADAGLSVADFTVLTAVSGEQHLRFEQLVGALALSPEETAGLVDGLTERGLLAQVLCARDGGGLCIELTGAGRRIHGAARCVHDRTLARVMLRAKQRPALAGLVEALQQAGLLPLGVAC